MFLLNNMKVHQDIQRTIGDVQYPAGWFSNAEARAKVGMIEVPDPVRPDDNLFTSVENPDGSFTATPRTAADLAARLVRVKSDLSKQIDAAVLAIYDRPMALSKEYEAREKAAADYKAAGYTGAVPTWLSSFATPAGLTATVAADLILSQALQMRDALDSLGALRMRKYEVQLASTEAEARTAHTDIMAQIAVVAADLG